jgi:hypothetical protein
VPMSLTESVVEEAALIWLESLGYVAKPGSEIASDEPACERQDYGRLRDTLLPKHISGELRVNRFEAVMKGAP